MTRVKVGARRMRSAHVFGTLLPLALSFCLLCPVAIHAELLQVEVGGEIRIRGRYFNNVWNPQLDGSVSRITRISDAALGWRPIGPDGTRSTFKWDSDGPEWARYETTLLLNVKADFTRDVSAFLELNDYHVWGSDFRSEYLTGADTRADSVDDVEFLQAYIEVRQWLGQPLRLRLGRQRMLFGKGWLVGDMFSAMDFFSFDAVRLTYAENDFTVDAFVSKLRENAFVADSDVNFYGIHGAYAGFAPVNLALYWFYVNDRTNIPHPAEDGIHRWINDMRDLEYGDTHLHTVGLRADGRSGGFDYDLEVAYQFGEAAHLGSMFIPTGGVWGDPDARYDNWGADVILGYTFPDTPWQPRLFAQGVLFEGQDNRDITFWEWLNPFYTGEASVSFNRLFSDKNYMPTVNDNTVMSNFIQASVGVEVQPTDKIRLRMQVARNWFYEAFDPPKSIELFGRRTYVAPLLSFWTDPGDRDMGWEVAASLRYTFSPNWWVMLYGNYLWTGKGLTDGGFTHFNATRFSGGSGDSDAAYVLWMTTLSF